MTASIRAGSVTATQVDRARSTAATVAAGLGVAAGFGEQLFQRD